MNFSSLFYSTVNVRTSASVYLKDDLRLTLNFAWSDTDEVDNQVKATDIALRFDYYIPSLHGVYIGLTFADIVFLSGYDSPSSVPLFLTALTLGWEWRLPFFSFDIGLSVLDAVSSSESAYETLSGLFDYYFKYRVHVLASFRYDFKNKEK